MRCESARAASRCSLAPRSRCANARSCRRARSRRRAGPSGSHCPPSGRVGQARLHRSSSPDQFVVAIVGNLRPDQRRSISSEPGRDAQHRQVPQRQRPDGGHGAGVPRRGTRARGWGCCSLLTRSGSMAHTTRWTRIAWRPRSTGIHPGTGPRLDCASGPVET